MIKIYNFFLGVLCIFWVAANANAQEKIIRVAQTYPAGELNPAFVQDTSDTQIHTALFETIIKNGVNGDFIPGLSTNWTVSEDGLVYDFTIRNNARWSDGHPITAQTISDSFNYVKNLDGASTYALSADFEVMALGEERGAEPDRVRFTLAHPDSFFMDKLAAQTAAILPMHRKGDLQLDQKIDLTRWSELPFSGPYLIKEATYENITLRPNPFYHSPGRVMNDGIDITTFNHLSIEKMREFKREEYHYFRPRPGVNITDIVEVFGDYVQIIDSPAITYIVFNVTEPPFDNRELRYALSLSADLGGFDQLAARSSLSKINEFLPSILNREYERARPIWSELSEVARFNLALGIMEDNGFTVERPLSIKFAVDAREPNMQIANLLRGSWSRIGVDVELVYRSWPDHLDAVIAKDFNVARMGWSYDYDHPLSFLEIFQSDSEFNDAGFSDHHYDETIDQLRRSVSLEDVNEASLVAQNILFEEAVVLPLFAGTQYIVARPELNGTEQMFQSYRYYESFHYHDEGSEAEEAS